VQRVECARETAGEGGPAGGGVEWAHAMLRVGDTGIIAGGCDRGAYPIGSRVNNANQRGLVEITRN
jgi:hypothetical protein